MTAMNEFKTVVVVIATLTLGACASQNTVPMEDGAYRAVTQDKHADLRVGDRVHFDNGVLQRY